MNYVAAIFKLQKKYSHTLFRMFTLPKKITQIEL